MMQFDDRDDQVRAIIRQLQDLQATRDNLKETQGRCNELLEENRKLRRENRALRETLDRVACAAVDSIAERRIDPFETPEKA